MAQVTIASLIYNTISEVLNIESMGPAGFFDKTVGKELGWKKSVA